MLVAFLDKLEHLGCGIEEQSANLTHLIQRFPSYSLAFCVITHNTLGTCKACKFVST